MKKLLFIALAALVMTACGGGQDPIKVAEQFAHSYFIEHDVAEYTKFLDADSRESLLSPVMADYHKEQQAKAKALKLKFELDKENTIVNESGASVYFIVTSGTDPDYRPKGLRADLKKDTDGNWFVKYYTFPTRF